MTRTSSHTVANLLLAAAGMAAAYYVMKDRGRRRLALRALNIAFTNTIPGYLVHEATSAWRETERRAA